MNLLSSQINYPFYHSVSSLSDDYLSTEEFVMPLTSNYLNLHQYQQLNLYPNHILNNLDSNNNSYNKYRIIEEEFIDMSNSSNQQQRNKYDFRGSNGMINGLGMEIKPNFMENFINPFNHREITEENIDYIGVSNGEESSHQRRASFKKVYPAGPYGLAQPGMLAFLCIFVKKKRSVFKQALKIKVV